MRHAGEKRLGCWNRYVRACVWAVAVLLTVLCDLGSNKNLFVTLHDAGQAPHNAVATS